jgi:DNA helicase-2/ATP-dependent DNA helicase PcrA
MPRVITAALSAGDKTIPHKARFDEAAVLLSARIAAFLLEPKSASSRAAEVIVAIELLALIPRASGSKIGIDKRRIYLLWANQLRQGKRPKELISAVEKLISDAAGTQLTGGPATDWLSVKNLLKSSSDDAFKFITRILDCLVAFNPGKRISTNPSIM